MPFISFSCLIALVRTSNTVLNRSGESGHPCLISNPRGKAFSFSPLSMMLSTQGLSYTSFIMLRFIPSILNLLRVFHHKSMLNFVSDLSASIEMIM